MKTRKYLEKINMHFSGGRIMVNGKIFLTCNLKERPRLYQAIDPGPGIFEFMEDSNMFRYPSSVTEEYIVMDFGNG